MFSIFTTLLVGSSIATVVPEIWSRDAGPTSKSARACDNLKAAFPARYVDASSANYTAKVEFNWSSSCDLPATCFFTPTSTEEVAKGLSIVMKAGSRFAVRSGGHNTNPEFGSINGGVLFDMTGMRSLCISPGNDVIYAGSGFHGGEVQAVADAIDRAVVTGIDTSPGLAGLTLGGGYTHFSQIHGLVTDNIVNFEVVLGNATVVNANVTHNTDLYRGLRGGMNNFGIVTRLDLRTSKIRKIWYSVYLLDSKDYVEIMKAIGQVQLGMEKDPKANIEILAAHGGFQVALWYAEQVATPEIFAPLLAFPPMLLVAGPTNGTILEVMKLMSDPKPPMASLTKSVIYKPSVELYIDLFEKMLVEYPTNASKNSDLVLAIKPMGSRVSEAGTKQAGVRNTMNIQPIPQIWGSILAQYEDPKDKDLMAEKLKIMHSWLTGYASEKQLLLPNLFANDAGYNQKVMASYGPELANLKAVSAKYDPAQVFQKLQADGFLISK